MSRIFRFASAAAVGLTALTAVAMTVPGIAQMLPGDTVFEPEAGVNTAATGQESAGELSSTAIAIPPSAESLEAMVAAMAHAELGFAPKAGVMVVFRSKRGDRIKVLFWDGSGIVMIYKRLEQGGFAWPKVGDGVMRLSRVQFEALFAGLDWRRIHAPRPTPPTATE